MTVTAVDRPVVGGVYEHRLADANPGQHRPVVSDVIVLAVVDDRARTWVLFRYIDHREGRRDAAVLSLGEFTAQYPTLTGHEDVTVQQP